MQLFFVDHQGKEYSYQHLLENVSRIRELPLVLRFDDCFDVFAHLVCAAYHAVDVILLDADISDDEMRRLEISESDLAASQSLPPITQLDFEVLISRITQNISWRVSLFTSGTTGLPKKVSHTISSLTRLVRRGERHSGDVWALAYNPTHMAGIQVFFQALLNQNPLIDVFHVNPLHVPERLNAYAVTHISATPTYYRMITSLGSSVSSIRKVTLGGEKYDSALSADILKTFPNARIKNVYASTEVGSLLESNDDVFTILDSAKCQVIDNELLIHASLVGEMPISGEWYHTGDLVDVLSVEPIRFRFVSRQNDMISVGGYKVNPHEVEEALVGMAQISLAQVYGKPNAILGNVLMADVVTSGGISEKEIRDHLKNTLQAFKIPRVINFVDNISITRTGKKARTQ